MRKLLLSSCAILALTVGGAFAQTTVATILRGRGNKGSNAAAEGAAASKGGVAVKADGNTLNNDSNNTKTVGDVGSGNTADGASASKGGTAANGNIGSDNTKTAIPRPTPIPTTAPRPARAAPP